MVVRAATSNDTRAMLRIGAEVARLLPFPLEMACAAEMVRRHMTDEDKLALVVEVHGKVVGAFLGRIGLHWGGVVAEELGWWIDPDHRGNGWRLLLDRYEAWAREKGAVAVMMPASEALPLVGGLLRRAGYRETTAHYFKRLTSD